MIYGSREEPKSQMIKNNSYTSVIVCAVMHDFSYSPTL